MKKRMYLTLLITSILVIWNAIPAFAQSSVDTSLLESVKTAFANTLAASSMTVNVQSQTLVTGQTDAVPMQQSVQSYQLAFTGTAWNVSGTQTTISNLPVVEDSTATQTTSTMEFIIVDGVTYVRFTAMPEMLAQQGLPQDWVTTDQLTQMPGGQLLASLPNDGSLPSAIIGTLSLPIDTTSVTAISELPADTLDGQSMRVFQVILDPASLANGDAAGLLNMGMGGGFGGQPNRGNGQPPADANFAPPADFTPPADFAPPADFTPPADFAPPADGSGAPPNRPFSAENFQVTVTAWVGDDNFVHRVSTAVTFLPIGNAPDGSAATGSSITTVSDYTQLNVPVTITVPQLAPS